MSGFCAVQAEDGSLEYKRVATDIKWSPIPLHAEGDADDGAPWQSGQAGPLHCSSQGAGEF